MNMPILTQFGNPEQKTMGTRVIAELCEKEHFHVKRDCEVMFTSLNLDASKFGGIYFDSMNRQQTEYLLDEELTMTLVTGYNIVLRNRVIKRWKELENRELSKMEILQMALESEQQKLVLQQQLEIQAPKVAFVDKYVAGNGNKTFRQVTKLLGANERKFRDFLKKEKIMYKLNGEWLAYQNHIDAKRFHNNTGISESNHTFTRSLFTPKGVEWTAGEWAKFNLRGAA